MLRLTNSNEVWWRIDVPDRDDDGELVTRKVRFRLRIFTRAELRERAVDRVRKAGEAVAGAMRQMLAARTAEDIDAAHAALTTAADGMAEAAELDAAEVRDRIVGWNAEDVTGEHGPVPFTPELRDALLADEARFGALSAGLLEASQGARAKNSLPGPAGSRAVAQAGVANGSGAATVQ